MEREKFIISRFREFNRFYTVLIGTLNKHFLGTDYSLTETRVLFELISNNDCKANDLVDILNIDKSYMSRIILSFEKKGLLEKHCSYNDRRANILSLTEYGKKTVNELLSFTNHQIADLVSPLTEKEAIEVIRAMDTITKYLDVKKQR